MNSIKAYLGIAFTAIMGILYAVFQSTKRENEALKQINKTQAESLHIGEVTDEVTNTLHIEHVAQEASIEASTEAVKQQIRKIDEKKNTSSDTLDPEFIRLLNKNRN